MMSYSPPRVLRRHRDYVGLNPQQALSLAEAAIKDGRSHDAERLIEIVYERLDAMMIPAVTRH